MNKSLFSLSVLAGWAFTLVSVIAVAAGPDTSGQVQQSAQQVASAPKHAKTALAVGVTLDQEGRLWLAKAVNQRLLVSWSEDDGKRFSEPVTVTPVPENIGNDGENRPKVQVAHDGTVLVTWTQLLAEKYAGNIKFSRSTDSGRTFSEPIVLNDDGRVTSHRFDSLAIDGKGRVVVAWLDARDRDAMREKGGEFKGISLYSSQSFDNGAHFEPNRQVHQHTCECCRTALAWTGEGPVVLLRNIFGGSTRDFAVVNLDKVAEGVKRATRDEWQIDACPHNGGSLATDGRGQLHLTWFTSGTAAQGQFYKRISGNRESKPMALGDADAQPDHAAVVAHGETVILTWREFDGNAYSARMLFSNDGGETWSKPWRLMRSAGASDYPVPLISNNKALVVWNTENEGLRVLPVERVINRSGS
ncbi:sialidase family protein [uncultured Nitrosomonas sp.]|uniref:sialidase family protein n=2 Tax=Nitrosomonas TaxID=914 RepID=UPI00261CFA21|nr:sialidase family protein [uncultured Nitrosomonas sp.]